MSHYSGSVPTTPRATDWRDTAACRNEEPEDWFPIGATPAAKAQERHAKAVCWRCPSMEACGQWALQTRQAFGIWGGTTEGERRAILRRRGIRLPDDREDDNIAPDTLRDLWTQRTQLADGHMAWTGSTPVSFRGHCYTPQRIGFQLDRGRPAQGIVRRTCERDGCVLPAHLMDQQERDAARLQASKAVAV